MPSREAVLAHRRELDDIATVMAADLGVRWGSLGSDVLAGAQQVSLGVAEDYAALASGAAADWYAEVRADAGVKPRYVARPTATAAPEQVVATARWAVAPLLAGAAPESGLSRLTAGLDRIVRDAARDTILDNAKRDPVRMRWYRDATPDCCAFCAMLAARGAVYRSKESALQSHNDCKCVAAPLFPGEDAPADDRQRAFTEDYLDAREAVTADGDRATTKAILARMRQLSGRR